MGKAIKFSLSYASTGETYIADRTEKQAVALTRGIAHGQVVITGTDGGTYIPAGKRLRRADATPPALSPEQQARLDAAMVRQIEIDQQIKREVEQKGLAAVLAPYRTADGEDIEDLGLGTVDGGLFRG